MIVTDVYRIRDVYMLIRYIHMMIRSVHIMIRDVYMMSRDVHMMIRDVYLIIIYKMLSNVSPQVSMHPTPLSCVLLTGSCCPRGLSTITSTSPRPAPNVSTMKRAGAPTQLPVGSIPGDKGMISILELKRIVLETH